MRKCIEQLAREALTRASCAYECFYDSSAVFQCYIMFHHVYVTIVREHDLTSKLDKFFHIKICNFTSMAIYSSRQNVFRYKRKSSDDAK